VSAAIVQSPHAVDRGHDIPGDAQTARRGDALKVTAPRPELAVADIGKRRIPEGLVAEWPPEV
jgi:hypothetical protein